MSKSSCAYITASLVCLSICSLPLKSYGQGKVEEDLNKATTACEQKLSIEAFRAYALNNSAIVSEIDRDYAIELAKAFEIETLANPELQAEHTYTRMNIGGANDPQSSVSIGQPLKLSNFGAKGKVAALIRKSGDTQKRAKVLELNQKLSVQFYTLYALQKTNDLIADAENRSTKKVALIKQGVNQGLLSIGDEKLFEGEKYRLQAQRKGLAASISALQNELAKTAGLSCSFIATSDRKLEEIPSREVLIVKAQQNNLSEVTRLNLLNELATEQVRLAELDTYPQITPRFLYQHTNDGGDYYGAGISIPLPFWNRNQGERLRTNAEQSAVQRKKTFLSNGGLELQIQNLREVALSSKEQAEIFSTKVVPAFEEALKSQERLYAEGKGNVLQVWQTLRTFNEVQTQALSFWLEAVAARLQLSILIGEEI